jgi:hypothetical protein
VQFVLLRIEEGIEIIPPREVALRRAHRKSIELTALRLMTDRARLLWGRGKLRHVAFDASFVTGEFQHEFPVALGRSDNHLVQFRLGQILVARIAFQYARMVRLGNIDGPEMRFMREAFVVYRLFSRLGIRLLLTLHGKRAQQESR